MAALLAEEEAEGLDAPRETIDDIEDTMIRIGDAVAREVGVQKLARHTGEASGSSPLSALRARGGVFETALTTTNH